MERRAYKAGVTPRMGPGNIKVPVKTSTYSFAELVVRTSEHHSINNDTECVKVNSRYKRTVRVDQHHWSNLPIVISFSKELEYRKELKRINI